MNEIDLKFVDDIRKVKVGDKVFVTNANSGVREMYISKIGRLKISLSYHKDGSEKMKLNKFGEFDSDYFFRIWTSAEAIEREIERQKVLIAFRRLDSKIFKTIDKETMIYIANVLGMKEELMVEIEKVRNEKHRISL